MPSGNERGITSKFCYLKYKKIISLRSIKHITKQQYIHVYIAINIYNIYIGSCIVPNLALYTMKVNNIYYL